MKPSTVEEEPPVAVMLPAKVLVEMPILLDVAVSVGGCALTVTLVVAVEVAPDAVVAVKV